MATYDQRHPGRFIKAGEFDGKPVTLTIASVDSQDLEKEDGTSKNEAIVSFREKGHGGRQLQWVMNKTNDQAISAMFGDEDANWTGKRVTLYPERDTSGQSDSGYCIRVQGSPDIKEAIEMMVKLPRRKPQKKKLIPTRMGAIEPLFDGETGEVESLDDRYGETMPEFEQ